MRQKRHLILRIACLISIAFCAMLLVQKAGVLPPAGASWGDSTRTRAYSFQAEGPIVFRTAARVRPAPPGSYAYGMQSLTRTEGFAISYHRWNMMAGRTPQAPVLGEFMEVRVALIWPVLISLSLVSLCVVLFVKQRRADRNAGGCLSCGYDLRATPERCPECGCVPAARPAQ